MHQSLAWHYLRACRQKPVRSSLLALTLALALLLFTTEALWATVELAYYRASGRQDAVHLQWATVREVNVNGFEILSKGVSDPEIAYHPLGSRIAQGGSEVGASYTFDVTSGLIPGEDYCFRLREITSDASAGESFDLCGYGLRYTAFLPLTHKQE